MLVPEGHVKDAQVGSGVVVTVGAGVVVTVVIIRLQQSDAVHLPPVHPIFFARGLMLVPEGQEKDAQVGSGVVVTVGAGVVVTVVTGSKQQIFAEQPPAHVRRPGRGLSVIGDGQSKPEQVGTGVVVTVGAGVVVSQGLTGAGVSGAGVVVSQGLAGAAVAGTKQHVSAEQPP